MIEAFKMMKIYDTDVIPDFEFSTSRRRGHEYKLSKPRASKKIRQLYFTQRIIDMWNRLPSSVVNAHTVPQFERRLDKHWSNEAFKYNYRAPTSKRSALNSILKQIRSGYRGHMTCVQKKVL